MSDFLLIFRGGEPKGSAEEIQKHMEKWRAWMEGLAKNGKLKGGSPLDKTGKVITGTKKLITDGPYAEAKEVVGGYLIISAANLKDATEMTKGCPCFEENGQAEIRPIRPME